MTPDGRWRLLIVGYVLVQMALRVLVGPALELDEAEAFVFGQELKLGYGPQPPLYFWLQWGLFRVLGETVLAIAALKAVMLGGTLILAFELFRRELPSPAAGAATLSTGFLFQLVYESQRSFTHSSMALLAAVWMGLATLRALRSGRWDDHLLLGLATAVGLLSKLNVAVWAAGLLLGALLLPEWRRRLRPWPLLAAGAVALLLNAPVFAWIWANPDLALRSTRKFEAAEGLAAVGRGLLALLLAALSFNGIGLLAAGLAWALGRAPGWRAAARPGLPSGVALMLAAAAASLGLVALGVVLSGTTEVRDRWLLPLSWPVVPAAVAWAWPALGDRARRGLAGAAAAFWLIAAAAMPYASLVDPGYRGSDWTGMEGALRGAGADDLPVFVTNTWALGNLLLRGEVPDARFLARPGELPAGPLILVVRAEGGEAEEPGFAARIERRQAVEVPRGTKARGYVVLTLAAG